MKKIFISFALLFANYFGNAQSVGIGTTAPDSSAILEVKSTNKGFLLPRLVDTSSITNPVKGLVIFNESDNKIWFYDGTQWQQNSNNLPVGDSIWKIGENINTIFTDKDHVAVNPNSNMPIPQNTLSVFNDFVVQQRGAIAAPVPSAATMNNTFTTQTLFGDKIIYDPAGAGINYFNNMVGRIKVWTGSTTNSSYQISFDANDFGLGTGDTLWISLLDYPACITNNMLMLTNTSVAPSHFNINTGSDGFRVIFRANSDGNNNKGFAITCKQIYLQNNANYGVATNTYGNALRFNSNTGSFLAGRQNGSLGSGAVSLGYSSAEGYSSFGAAGGNAIGDYSMAMGIGAKAEGERSFGAVGGNAKGDNSISMGLGAKAIGSSAVALGYFTDANGEYSTAIGPSNNANAIYSTSIGRNNNANADYSTTIGSFLNAKSYAECVVGSNNFIISGTDSNSWVATDPLFTVGNGFSSPSNALVVYKNANTDINGYTRLGKQSEGAPIIKMKKLTGISGATQNGFGDVTHGLNRAKIIGVQVIMKLPAFVDLGPGSRANAGYEYEFQILNSVIRVANVNGNSANILSKDFVVLITYEE